MLLVIYTTFIAKVQTNFSIVHTFVKCKSIFLCLKKIIRTFLDISKENYFSYCQKCIQIIAYILNSFVKVILFCNN